MITKTMNVPLETAAVFSKTSQPFFIPNFQGTANVAETIVIIKYIAAGIKLERTKLKIYSSI